jgi:hypothetical protein
MMRQSGIAFSSPSPSHITIYLALTYFFVIMRIYAGKVRPSQDTQGY